MRVAGVIRSALLGAALFCCFSCTGRSAEREEARQLLALLLRLSDEHTLASRQRLLDDLARMPLRVPAHARARDDCQKAHAELLRGETEQASAKQALQSGQTGTPQGPLPAERAHHISELIARSNEALANSSKLFPVCESAMAKLVTEAR